MAYQDFIDGLKKLDFVPEELGNNRVKFPYKVQTGKFSGENIEIGFDIPPDFPLSPPSGPHVSPQLLPMSGGGGTHPSGGVHKSNFGPEWEYWSRPLSHWAKTGRTVSDVMSHVRRLFDTQ